MIRNTLGLIGGHGFAGMIRCNILRSSSSPVFVTVPIRGFASLDDKFSDAQQKVVKLNEEPDNGEKLRMYALYKQSTEGANTKPKPGAFDFVAKAKWDAWSKLGQISKEEAKEQYVKQVDELIKKYGIVSGSGTSDAAREAATSSKGPILGQNINGVLKITLNRPQKYNAFTVEMYQTVAKLLNEAAKDKSVKFAVITGAGDYYSSGNDLSNFRLAPGADFKKFADDGIETLSNFVEAFIKFPKPLIAAVNGPAVGILVTTLGLCDLVIASDTASFHCPFSSLAQSPEGCSSYTFPRMIGYSHASQMLLFNHKMSIQEAKEWGFVGQVLPKSQFESYVNELIDGNNAILKHCQPISLNYGKQLMRTEQVRKELLETNRVECERLKETWLSPEFPKVIAKFFARKN